MKQLNILIYNINSFGGNYGYSIELADAYRHHKDVNQVTLLQPRNATVDGKGISKALIKDIYPGNSYLLRKLHFLYRSFCNPFRLYAFIRDTAPSVVLLNDFDQLSAFFWAPFFRRLRNKTLFVVMLHDPDRDAYLPSKKLSSLTMAQVMSVAHIAFFHGALPDKSYYRNTELIKAIVPHGIFKPVEADPTFLEKLMEKKKGYKLLGLLGNIREEKNYELILSALRSLPECILLVAGKKAHSGVPVEKYAELVRTYELTDRVIWIERYLSEEEMSAAITACDLMLMYYRTSFTSQSGILNKIAPYHKPVIVTASPSALNETVIKYGLGLSVKPDNEAAFVEAVNTTLSINDISARWEEYTCYASWDSHVETAVNIYQKMLSKGK